MKSKDLSTLAKEFVDQAVLAKSGDKVWIEYNGKGAFPLADACSQRALDIGAKATLYDVGGHFVKSVTSEVYSLRKFSSFYMDQMKNTDCFIRIKDNQDLFKAGRDSLSKYDISTSDAVNYRASNTRWLTLYAPTASFARDCGMSKSQFNKFYLDACTIDYAAMNLAANPLKELLERSNDVVITGLDTHLEFSIANIPAVKCVGLRNRPDGEVYTAPEKYSMNGHVAFGPSRYLGETFNSINLKINDGCIVHAKAHDKQSTQALNRILDTDKGSRYFGEFAIAFNPKILNPVGNILFDEKIRGSFHMAAGQCHQRASNGNKSAIHWDMVNIHHPDYGGGKIILDGRVIQKDGRFVVPELEGLNPEHLL